ncbi:MAG: hypothetical protein AAF805_03425 [Planctomycetota bacterium]
MDPSGPNAADLRELVGRAQTLAERAGEEASAARETRREAADRLGADAAAAIEALAAQIAADLAADAASELDAQVAADREAVACERSDFEAARDAWLAEKADWEAVRDEVEAELAAQESRLTQLTADGAAGDAALTEQNTRLSEELAQLKATLGDADRALHESAELREKFDIALADLQSHRTHIGELEAELAARPEPGADESAELAQLREERDDLWRELEETRSTNAPDAEGSGGEELEDLRRRFELAVEEVRELKTQNAELQERAASSGDTGDAGDDWEAQKRRLLAELEAEGEPTDPHRAEERATIAGTIQITDEVVAEKDREIERLRAEVGGDASDGAAADAAAAALLDEDEVIRQERERLVGLETQWEEKLRAAELELSVERAKIARAQSEIAEQQLELETLRAAAAAAAGESGEGEASRKWLSKLGLGAGGDND